MDGLRACSILLVVATHAILPDIRAEGFGAGFVGVDIFFVLSGFLITCLLINEWQHTGSLSLRRFYARRALRLLPALFLVLASFVLYGYIAHGKWGAAQTAADALIPIFYVANWTRAFGLDRPALFPHTWSLSIEEQFYMLWPLTLLFLLRTCRSSGSILRLLLLALYLAILNRVLLCEWGATAERIGNGTDTRCDALLFGCLLGASLTLRTLPKSRLAKLSIRAFAWASIAALAFFSLRKDFNHVFAREFFYPLVSLAASGIILEIVTAEHGLLSRLLSNPGLVFIGKISYGLYLWHVPIFMTTFSQGWCRTTELLVALSATAIATLTCYYLAERPALKLKKRFGHSPPREVSPVSNIKPSRAAAS